MRCPKCGFITFDHLESCVKCGKNIVRESDKLSGTVFKASLPLFLRLDKRESNIDAESLADTIQEEEFETEFSLEGEELGGGDFFEEEASDVNEELLDASDTVVEELDEEEGIDFVLSADEDHKDLKFESKEGEGEGGEVDFNGLDISDLAPPETDSADTASEELSLDQNSTESVEVSSEAVAKPLSSGTGLEDLHTDGLDLDTPFLPPEGSNVGKNLRPTIKTGTALDDFDVDLGELMADFEK